jgi:hypothetical protein
VGASSPFLLVGIQAKLSDHYPTGIETTFSILMVCVFVLVCSFHPIETACRFAPSLWRSSNLTRPEAALIPGFTALTILAVMDRHRWLEAQTIRWFAIAAGLLVG